ncbi:MAG: hypothetical protein IKC22_00850 [Bacilli bacterium]|nr:hypothetical protein [bacterium]MBR2890931.1 hypothetical protein [Bacilli bacterium]
MSIYQKGSYERTDEIIKGLLIFCGVIVILGIIASLMVNVEKQTEKEKQEKELYCKRILIEEDYIEVGCDEVFKNEKWYIDYMKYIEDEYKKIGVENNEN